MGNGIAAFANTDCSTMLRTQEQPSVTLCLISSLFWEKVVPEWGTVAMLSWV